MSNYRRHYSFGKITFITIVIYNRQPILPDNIELIRNAWKSVKYPFKIHAGVVLKDHIHILIEPENTSDTPKIISFCCWDDYSTVFFRLQDSPEKM